MIGLVVTGHAEFASGIVSALELLAGTLQGTRAVNFPGTQSADELAARIAAAADELSEADGVLICTDVLGGSPFKAAATLAVDNPRLKVVAGTSLPLLIEAYMAHGTARDVDALAAQAVEAARGAAIVYEPVPYVEETSEDGI